MEKQNLRGEELALARTLAREFATKYNRRRVWFRQTYRRKCEDALRHKFGHAADYALDEYRARFACYYGMMSPEQLHPGARACIQSRHACAYWGAGAGGSLRHQDGRSAGAGRAGWWAS